MSYILRIHKIKKFTKTKLQQKPFSHSFRPSVLQSACVSDLFFSLFSKKSVWRTLRTRALSLCKDDKLKNLRQMGTCFCIMDDLRIRLVLSVLLFEPKFTNNVNLNKGLHSSFLFFYYTLLEVQEERSLSEKSLRLCQNRFLTMSWHRFLSQMPLLLELPLGLKISTIL